MFLQYRQVIVFGVEGGYILGLPLGLGASNRVVGVKIELARVFHPSGLKLLPLCYLKVLSNLGLVNWLY